MKHYHSLLSAEHASLNRKDRAAESHYKDTIRLAARTGHLHHAGPFNERYADFLRHELEDEGEANYHIEEAIRWYTEWGAERKN